MTQYRFPWFLYRSTVNIPTCISTNRYSRLPGDVDKAWVEPIRRLRTSKGWSQGELASQAGVRANTLSEALNSRSPRMDTLEKVAAALGVPLWALFVDERQFALLMQQRTADDSLAREQDISARVEAQVIERLSAMIKQATTEAIHNDAAQAPSKKRVG